MPWPSGSNLPQTGDGLYVADVSKYNQGNIGTGDGNITQSQFDEYKKTVVTIDGKELTNSYTYAKYDFSGSSIPDVYGGFNVRVSYKNFELAAVFSYQLGGQILDTNYATMMSMTEFGYAQSPDLLKAWRVGLLVGWFPFAILSSSFGWCVGFDRFVKSMETGRGYY